MKPWKGLFAIASVSALFGILSNPGDEPHEPVKLTDAAQRRIDTNDQRPSATVAVPDSRSEDLKLTLKAIPLPTVEANKALCPLMATDSDSELYGQIIYQRAAQETDPAAKFVHFANAYEQLYNRGYARVGTTQSKMIADMQIAARGAFDALLLKYPHGKLATMDQVENISDVAGKPPLETLRDIQVLRWSMSNLHIKAYGVPDTEQSHISGGVDISLLNRLVAKLVLDAAPEVYQKLKDLPKDQRQMTEADFNDYELYKDLLEYSVNNAAADAGRAKKSWQEMGFKDRNEWRALRDQVSNEVSKREAAFAKDVQERCAPVVPQDRKPG